MTETVFASDIAFPGATSIRERLRTQAQRPQQLRLRELIGRYMAVYAGRDTTRTQRLSAWQSMLGDFLLEEITVDAIKTCRQALSEDPAQVYKGKDFRGRKVFGMKVGKGPRTTATVNRYMASLSAVFTWAAEERLTPAGWSNPCRTMRRLPEKDGRVRFLDEAERGRLFKACKASSYPRLFALVLMAMKTGARRGELLALTWRDVDLDAGRASLGRSKNGDRRVLVLLSDVIEALRPFESSDPARLVFGSVRSKYHSPVSLETPWRTAVAAAALKNFKFHDLRHCCASYLAQAGTPLNVIAEVLGHRRLDMSQRYAHLTVATKASAMLAALGSIQ
jgi:integrase